MFEIIDGNSNRSARTTKRDFRLLLNNMHAGQRLAVVLPSGLELAHVLLEAFRRGIVSVPINPRLPHHQIEFVIRHSEAHSVYRINDGLVETSLGNEPSPSDDRFIIYTSGSTGDPKGVVLTEKAVLSNARSVANRHEFGTDNPHATCLPLFHCNALMMSLIGCSVSDTKLVVFPRFDPTDYFAAIDDEGVRTASIVPALLHRLVAAAPLWPPCLQYLITAAAPLSRELARQFHRLYGPRLCQGYGLTEAVNFSFVSPQQSPAEFVDEYLESYPHVGVPLPGTECRFVNSEIQVRGPNLMRGYWNNEQDTRDALTPDGWLRTGDLGVMRGSHLVLNGRIKDVINRGGESFHPTAVEEEWDKVGVPKPFTAMAIPNEQLADDFGLWCEQTDVEPILSAVENSSFIPGAVQTGPRILSATGKPIRRQMSEQLFSVSDGAQRYERLLAYSVQTLSRILASSTQSISTLSAKMPRSNPNARIDARAMSTSHPRWLEPRRAPAFSAATATIRDSQESFSTKLVMFENLSDDTHLTSAAQFVLQQARVLVDAAPRGVHIPEMETPMSAAREALAVLEESWSLFATGEMSTNQDSRFGQYWERSLVEWPMDDYAKMVARFLIQRELLQGRVLEIGNGVGSTSRLLTSHLNDRFTRTESCPALLQRISTPGTAELFDFNEPGKWREFDTIFAANRIHCSRNHRVTVGNLYDMLKSEGVLVMGEVAPTTTRNGCPWALTALSGLRDDWHTSGGFLSRRKWLEILIDAGFRNWGYVVLRAGHHDLGGIVWGVK